VCFSTNTKLNADLQLALHVTGLKGRDSLTDSAVPVKGPASGEISVQSLNTSESTFNSSGAWNLTAGSMIVGIRNDTQPDQLYCFRFLVINPVKAQECATANLSLSGLDMKPITLLTSNNAFCSLDLEHQGECQAGPFPRVPATLAGGGCPLKVVAPEILLKTIGQSTARACTVNTITVSLAFNVPLLCSSCSDSGLIVSITGLNGTETLSDSSMPVMIYGDDSMWSRTAIWNQQGSLSLDLSQAPRTAACENFSFSFNVTNSHVARSSPPVVEVNSSCLPTPTQGMTFAPGEAAPLAEHLGMCTMKTMSQMTPWPGAENTLKLKFSTNVSLVAHCGRILIDNLQEACASDGMMHIGCRDAAKFSMGLRGTSATGMWRTYTDDESQSRQGSLELWLLEDTEPGTEYEICFNVTNPAVAQSAPNIEMVIKQKEFTDTCRVEHDLDTIPPNPCANDDPICELEAGDAAPLKIRAPAFLKKEIGQSTPYPCQENEISVTLLSNIPMQHRSLITISNLAGALTASGHVNLSGTDASLFKAEYCSLAPTSYGAWDSVAKKLTLVVGTGGLPAGVNITFSFHLKNPCCEQPSPAVCLWASRISACGSRCSEGHCVVIPRQVHIAGGHITLSCACVVTAGERRANHLL